MVDAEPFPGVCCIVTSSENEFSGTQSSTVLANRYLVGGMSRDTVLSPRAFQPFNEGFSCSYLRDTNPDKSESASNLVLWLRRSYLIYLVSKTSVLSDSELGRKAEPIVEKAFLLRQAQLPLVPTIRLLLNRFSTPTPRHASKSRPTSESFLANKRSISMR